MQMYYIQIALCLFSFLIYSSHSFNRESSSGMIPLGDEHSSLSFNGTTLSEDTIDYLGA
jgi:hypothetical protein